MSKEDSVLVPGVDHEPRLRLTESKEEEFRHWADLVWKNREGDEYSAVKLRLYGLYKYISFGPCNVPKPSYKLGQEILREKWDSWTQAGTFTKEEAIKIYIETAKQILTQQVLAGSKEPVKTPLESGLQDDGNIKEETTRKIDSNFRNRLKKQDSRERFDMCGWLWKWRDRVAYMWGGSKWDLYFFTLEGTILSIYITDTEPSPVSQMNLRSCILKDEGLRAGKYNSRTKVTPSYHVFGIYIPGNGSSRDDDEDILLRLSTDKHQEGDKWVAALEAACSSDSDSDVDVGYATDDSTDLRPSYVSESLHEISEIDENFEEPDADHDTIRIQHRKSNKAFYAQQQPMLKKTKSKKKISSSAAAKKIKITRFSPFSYPGSKTMHKDVQPSFLSGDSSQQNYRGFLNLCGIILIVNNIRFIWLNLRMYGVIFSFPRFNSDKFSDWPCLSGTMALNVHLLIAFFIEFMSKPQLNSKRRIPESWIMSLHFFNNACELFIPVYIVWHYTGAPLFGFLYLFTAVILWMKLISYAHCNRDLRLAWYHSVAAKKSDLYRWSKSLICKGKLTMYPGNVTIPNLYYFWFAPTLSYQLNYPKTPSIRRYYVANLFVRLIFLSFLMVLIFEQYILPALQSSFHNITQGDRLKTLETLLALSIPSTYIWLLMFYGFFHVLLNFLAEILRFGDRIFYRDWWNATTIEAYWRLWNVPVHYWMVRHIYFPCLRAGISKSTASVICFILSAIFHELLISVPFRMIKVYAFFGMLFNVVLLPVTKAIDSYYGKGSQVGNWIFWLIFCIVGQPMSVLLYYRDYCSSNVCTMPFATENH